jgi:DNA-binding LytR/AlgR family response regulator
MIQCLIVDDEEIARQHMARLLSAYPDLVIAGEASNGVEAIQVISDINPDVVFLDIEMPELTAFDVLDSVRHPPLIVFATAYDKYAVAAFEANAIDYLLKPIDAGRFSKTIEKIRAAQAKPREDYASILRKALSELRAGPPEKVAARRGRRIVLLAPKDILFARIEDGIVFLHSHSERFATDRTITELEELLSPAGFCRINRSALVNLAHAQELLPWSSGTWKVKLSNNTELEVSRERGRELKSRIG